MTAFPHQDNAALLSIVEETLSLKQLHETLKLAGVSISYSGLSELISTGDIATLLHVGGKGNRKEFLPETADVLAAFLPMFWETAGVTKDAAPALLRTFLNKQYQDDTPGQQMVPSSSQVSEIVESVKTLSILMEIRDLLDSRIPPMEDRLIPACEAAQLLACKPRSVSRYVRPVRPGVYKRSSILRYIAQLTDSNPPQATTDSSCG